MIKHSPQQESPSFEGSTGETSYPLSSPQMGVYAGWAAYPQTMGYNLPSVVPFPRTVDAGRLAEAMQRIADSREVLHTRIIIGDDGQPRQYADMRMPVRVRRMRMSEEEAQHFFDHDFVRPFPVGGAEPLCRLAVVETPMHHYLAIDLHHLIADGHSIVHCLLGVDLPRAYRGDALLPAVGSMYQLAADEQARCLGCDYQASARYQQTRFLGVPFARLSGEVPDAWGVAHRRSTFIDRAAIDTWCATHGVAPNVLLMGAFGLVLARWCHRSRIAFTVINHGRRGRTYADAYGMFVRSAPVIADTHGVTVSDYLRSMRRELTATVRHAVYPFTLFCRDMGVSPDVAFGFQAKVQETVTLGDCTVQGRQLTPPMTRNDLSCMVYLSDHFYEVRMESSAALHTAHTLQTVADAVAATVANMMVRPERALSDLAIVSADEQGRLLRLSQGEQIAYDGHATFIDLFLRQVAATPDAVAVTDGTGCLTYGELAAEVKAQAGRLRLQGYRAGDLVVVEAVQSKDFLIAALAAWRIGAGYEVPVSSPKGDVFPLSLHSSAPPPHRKTSGQPPAYLLYTSGSTGEPKGVLVSQKAVMNLIHFIVRQWRLTDRSRICCHASVAFDASVEDLYPVLTVGGQLFIAPESVRRDPDRLYHYIVGHGITGGCMTTQWGVLMAQRYDLPLDYLCLGGERLTVAPSCRGKVINTYGPTEATVDATYYELEPGRSYDTIPIGRPLPNLAAYVVDAEGHLLPQGAPGELWLAGPQLADGYWGDEALTATKFTACRFAEGRVYHTGDVVRWNVEGQLEYIGRTDRQAKLRGYRIEPGEVECAIARLAGVQQAAVVVRQIGAEARLCAYYVACRPLPASEVRSALSARLPAYKVPTAYMQIGQLPLTAQDKVDYAALPMPPPLTDSGYVAPMTDDERRWCGLFARVLGVARVGVTDDFFALGGTSLSAIHLLSAAADEGLRLTYDQIFEHPTVRGILGCGAGDVRVPVADPSCRIGTAGRDDFLYSVSAPLIYLTGATGFLGIHVLGELLGRGSHVVCLVRADSDDHAAARLLSTWEWYFPHQPKPDVKGSKLTVYAADITDPSLASMSLPRAGKGEGLLIHCAADVRQYAAGDQLHQTNVEGTRHVIALCQRLHLRLFHISTLSLGQPPGQGVGNPLRTPYLRSKAEAERWVADAVERRVVKARILRVGNLTARHSDGVFQRFPEENGFHLLTEGLKSMGCYPQEYGDCRVDLSPVDDTARAVVDVMDAPTDDLIVDVSNPEKQTVAGLARQWHLTPVTADVYHRCMATAPLTSRQRLVLAWLEMSKRASDETQLADT